MNVVLFGGTGMVGQGVLGECLRDSVIRSVLLVSRQAVGVTNPRLRQILHSDFQDFSSLANEFRDLQACFFCLGVSALGMKEADYRRITYDTTMAAAWALFEASPDITFEYISGQGTDTSERGRSMWARVKGATENALLQMPFKAAYMFRPGFIVPLDGIRSKMAAYRIIYAILQPFTPLLMRLFPRHVTDTQRLGRAMIRAAKTGAPKRVLEMRDISGLV